MIKTKSVFSPIEAEQDGLRILASRFRGRGMPSNRYDVWMANLGPSEALLQKILADKLTWNDFSRRYKKELLESNDIDKTNRTIKNHGQKFTLRLLQRIAKDKPITFMCQCAEDEPHCHRHLLAKLLQAKI